ncbi:MAG: Hsp33 family molecular chaperone HslO [Alicyclobacillus sp.]|nr:Hsp33 family molecular chaperone HslO [Alicyclobacillus sp.]
MQPDQIARAIAMGGHARVFSATTTQLVNELQRRHDTWPVVTAALGRTATIASMMGSMLKNNERLTIQIQGDGPIGKIVVDADAAGNVRGYVDNPHVHFPPNAHGKLDVAAGVGAGMLYVMRDLGMKEFYQGSAALQTGEIADDFTYYFAVSEQIPSAVAAGVLVDTDNRVLVAGGFIVQLLPGHDDAEVSALEARIAGIHSVTKLLQDGADASALLRMVAPDAGDITLQPVQFRCTCSKERLRTVLKSLGDAEIRGMIEDQGQAEVRCHFCNERYVFSRGELEELLEQPDGEGGGMS